MLAQEAARIIVDQGLRDYRAAKLKGCRTAWHEHARFAAA